MFSSNCCFLTCTEISQDAGQVVWYSYLMKNFPVCCDSQIKGFGIVNKAKIDVFLKLSCFFDDPVDVGNVISGSSAFSKSSWTSGSSWFMYCWSLAWRFLSVTLLAWKMSAVVWEFVVCSAVVWTFFGIAFLWDWNEKWPFSSPMATAEFSRFAGMLSEALSQHHLLGFEIAHLEFHHLH